jgi:hypothetical protein
VTLAFYHYCFLASAFSVSMLNWLLSQALCNGNEERMLLFECFDWNKTLKHEIIGSFQVHFTCRPRVLVSIRFFLFCAEVEFVLTCPLPGYSQADEKPTKLAAHQRSEGRFYFILLLSFRSLSVLSNRRS